jgi:hypothetical protein
MYGLKPVHTSQGLGAEFSAACKAVYAQAIYGTVENGLSMVFITLGEPPAHGDTAEPVPFVKSPFPIC